MSALTICTKHKGSAALFTQQDIKRGILVGLLYEQNALLRAYGSNTFQDRHRALDEIADEIFECVKTQSQKANSLSSEKGKRSRLRGACLAFAVFILAGLIGSFIAPYW
jgi:hypothetical protein